MAARAKDRGPRLLDYLQGRESAMVSFIERLARAESPSAVRESQRRVRGMLGTALEELGFATTPISGRSSGGHLYARPHGRTRGRPVQLLLGHCDTVWPIGTLQDMPVEVDGNVIRGPGVFDMKGGLAQMVFALEALRELDIGTPLTPVVFVNSDEEIGSRESGRFVHMLARRVERALVLEPSLGPAGALKLARKGVGRFTITVHGKAAHAGLDPEGGASAILELSHVIQRLFELNDPGRGITVNVGTIDGGIRPNVIAPHSQASVDVRVPTHADADRIEREIRGIAPCTGGVRIHVEGRFGRPPMERTPRNDRLWELALALGEELGLSLESGLAGGGSDGSTTSLHTATLDGLGPVGDGAHARHEFLYIDQTIQRTALVASLLAAPSTEATARG